jgi:hypothetical protein
MLIVPLAHTCSRFANAIELGATGSRRAALFIAVFVCLLVWPSDAATVIAGRTFTIGAATVPNAISYADLDAFAKAVKCVRPGDGVLLEEGKVFLGSLRLTVCSDSTTSTGLIEVRSFNPAAPLDAAMVRSSATIEAAIGARTLGLKWEQQHANELPAAIAPPRGTLAIYKLGPFSQDVAEVFYGGKRLILARAPSELAGDNISRFARTSRITSRQEGCPASVCVHTAEAATLQALQHAFSKAGHAAGLYAVIRNSPWSFARSSVSDIDVNTGEIRLAEPISGPGFSAKALPTSGYGFTLLNSPAFLDAPGEWYFDRATRTLYMVWNIATPPLDQQTQITHSKQASNDKFKHEDAALSFWGNSNSSGDSYKVDISRLTIRHSAGHGVRVLHVPDLRIADIAVEQPRESGIAVHGVQGNVEIASSSVTDAPGNGITVSSAKTVRIESNKVSKTGYLANQSRLDMELNGIRAGGFQTAYLARNTVASVGYSGVLLSEPPATAGNDAPPFAIEIVENVVSDFCRLLNDCGAIYVNGSLNASNKETTSPGTIKRIAGNEISLPGGNLDGAPGLAMPAVSSNPTSGAYVRMVGAVYLDHSASNFDVHGNKVAGKYEPYGWRIFNKGLFNACNRQEANACRQTKSSYRCYTEGLDLCNSISRE